MIPSDPVIILDFETTGMSPDEGARVTEVGAVLIDSGQIVERFQSLANAGVRIPMFIQGLTGISNAMIRKAPPIVEVMERLGEFIGDTPLVAHNASFDRRFLDAELARIRRPWHQTMACSLLLSRRVFQNAPSHSLTNLTEYLALPTDGVHHRALADATLTAHLWLRMQAELQTRCGVRLSFAMMQRLQKVAKRDVERHLLRISASG